MGTKEQRLILRCQLCKNYLGYRTCHAFREEIPLDIFTGENNHAEPKENQDNDFFFEEIEKKK